MSSLRAYHLAGPPDNFSSLVHFNYSKELRQQPRAFGINIILYLASGKTGLDRVIKPG